MAPTPSSSSEGRGGGGLDADIEQGIAGTRARNEAELLGMAAPTLDNNPSSVFNPGFAMTSDQQRSASSGALPDPVAVAELQQALAREEAEGFGGSSRVGYGPGGYFNSNGELVIEITRGANALPHVAASTNASALGISDEAVDGAIAAGETSAWDAAGYAARVTGYEVWNFLTAGFVRRHDERLTAEANGQLSTANLWRATALDAAGSVGSLYLGGRVSTYAFNRLGAGYVGYMGGGAAGGAVFDLVQQGTQLGINAITGGQTGQDQFSLNELALATSGGAALGALAKYGASVDVGAALSSIGRTLGNLRFLGSTSGPQLANQVGAVGNLGISGPPAAGAPFAQQSTSSGLASSRVVAPETVERYLIERVGWSPARARGYVDSFDGPITARISRPSQQYLRYLDGSEGSGYFLTRDEFFSPVDARRALNLDPNPTYTLNPNLATSRQAVTSTQRSIVFEGAVRGGSPGVRQTVITDTANFLFGPGYRYY